jgi:hypothetical protein
MDAVRRLAAAGGHTLPERIAPAKNNLTGILGSASSRDQNAAGGPWLIAAVVAATGLLGALLIFLYRRSLSEPDA